MSLTGQVNKISGDVYRAVNRIAQRGITGLDGMPRGTKKTMGYVCAIHEDGELAGTIDVQEFNYEPGEYEVDGVGHHKGVFLSAIQDNPDGFLIVPMLFSEVVIALNPTDNREYVLMYSHAQKIKLNTRSIEGENNGQVELGVIEVENFEETDEGLTKDYDELEPTKNKTSTIYTAKTITDQITSPDDETGYKEEKTVEHKVITVGDTTITINGSSIDISTNNSVTFKVGGSIITEQNGKISIETNDCEIKGSNVKVNGSSVTITGGTLKTQGASSTDLNGPFNAIKVCPFSGAPHCGSQVSGT